MTRLLFKTPLLILFLLSILPVLAIELLSPKNWGYLNIFIFAFFSAWLYSIVKVLSERNQYDKETKLGKFTAVLIWTAFYSISLSIYFALTFNKYEDPKWFPLIIIPGQIFLFYCVFYLTSFIAKLICTVEQKRIIKFQDYLGYFFLFFIFPIGIWWIHPKINQLTKS